MLLLQVAVLWLQWAAHVRCTCSWEVWSTYPKRLHDLKRTLTNVPHNARNLLKWQKWMDMRRRWVWWEWWHVNMHKLRPVHAKSWLPIWLQPYCFAQCCLWVYAVPWLVHAQTSKEKVVAFKSQNVLSLFTHTADWYYHTEALFIIHHVANAFHVASYCIKINRIQFFWMQRGATLVAKFLQHDNYCEPAFNKQCT